MNVDFRGKNFFFGMFAWNLEKKENGKEKKQRKKERKREIERESFMEN